VRYSRPLISEGNLFSGLWSEFLATDTEDRVRFPALPDVLRSSGSVMGSTQPHEYN
jgi:hypothetical protein